VRRSSGTPSAEMILTSSSFVNTADARHSGSLSIFEGRSSESIEQGLVSRRRGIAFRNMACIVK